MHKLPLSSLRPAPALRPPLPARQAAGSAKEGPRMTEEYCRDLCAEVRLGRIDPVRLGGRRWYVCGAW